MTERQKERFMSYIRRAEQRAQWYAQTYKNAVNFQKMFQKNFWDKMGKQLAKITLNEEQKEFLKENIPVEFRSSDKRGVVYGV